MPELTANQIVAYNLMRVRKALNLTQEQAATRLEPHLGVCWSKAVYSAAERSYEGKRIRRFTADDIAAFSIAFDAPVEYFFRRPPTGARVSVPLTLAFGAGSSGLEHDPEFLRYIQRTVQESVLRYNTDNPRKPDSE